MRRIVILGNGVGGVTAARYLRKLDDEAEILIVSGESEHFFSRTALMYIYMGHMRYQDTKPYEDHFWAQNRLDLMQAWIQSIDFDAKRLYTADGDEIEYDVLILATGSVSNKFGWPGQDLDGVQGLYSLQDLERLEAETASIERAVIVGGGLIGIELAEMLNSRKIPVTFLVREASWMKQAYPPEESSMINDEILHHGIDLRLSTELDRVLDDGQGRARGVVTKDGETIDCQLVGLTTGVRPNVDFLKDGPLDVDRGILVDDRLATNIENVYAIGDCAQIRQPLPGRRPVEPLWYTGRMMGQAVARVICGGDLTYDPGLWFNSAKFFDLEWQVYGHVAKEPGDGQETLFWRHPEGRHSLRINYRSEDQSVVGIQVIGIRYRHQVCEEWILDRRPLPWVLQNLSVANFDPEFYPQHEQHLINTYNQRYPESPVRLRRKRGLASLFRLRRAS